MNTKPLELLDPGLGLRPNLLKHLPARPTLAFPLEQAPTPRQALQWQQRARQAFAQCVGPALPTGTLKTRVLERKQLRGYHRTTFTLATTAHLKALCWYCVPEGVSASNPRPALIATPGHGVGAKDLIALKPNRKQRPEGVGYQKDYALQAVRLGYPTLVIEPLGLRQRVDPRRLAADTGCYAGVCLATMLGATLAGIRINDLRRGLDWLLARPEVLDERVGLMGISGGGQMTLWTLALEPRLRVGVVSGYFNSFRTSIMGMYHCVCNVVPGLATQLDMTDLAALVAPRPLLIESAQSDPIFPIQHSRRAFRTTQRIYDVWDARARVQQDVFPGDHQWSGAKLEAFLAQWL